MLQAPVILDHHARHARHAPAQRGIPSRPLTRWLLVASAVGVIGVSIDLFQGPAANALPAPTAQGAALAALSIDHSVVKNLSDDVGLEPGASVAAYDAPISEPSVKRAAPAAANPMADDTLEPGASVGAYAS
jgi:hypothetical protein